MVKMSTEERKFIEKILGKEALEWNICKLQDRLNIYMVETGFDENGDITDYGREIERLYDSIHYQNPDEE